MLVFRDGSSPQEGVISTYSNVGCYGSTFTAFLDYHKDINRLGVLHVEWLRRLVGCHSHCYPSCNKLEILLNAGLDVDTPGLLHSSVAGSCLWGCFLIFVWRVRGFGVGGVFKMCLSCSP